MSDPIWVQSIGPPFWPANFVVVPLASDLFSLQGLKNLGPNLREWRTEWLDRLDREPADPSLAPPPADMRPIGYIVLQHAVRLDRPVKAYQRWMDRIPAIYASEVLGDDSPNIPMVANDSNCLATLKNYRSLMPLAQDALKPMFNLKPADGALGGNSCRASLLRGLQEPCQEDCGPNGNQDWLTDRSVRHE